MELNTAYQYKALDKESYNCLADYATTIPATVTLHPDINTIVISENASEKVGEFIDNEGLSFHIHPIEVDDENLNDVIENETTDADTLRKIIYRMMGEKEAMMESHKTILADITAQRDKALKRGDTYSQMWKETSAHNSRVKSQVQAIAALVSAIFEK